MYWAALSDKGNILPSTIREKAGDSVAVMRKLFLYQHSFHKDKFKLVKVEVRIADHQDTVSE